MPKMLQILRRLRDERRGSLLAETAITLSVLVFVTLAGIEIGRYTLLHQKLERIAASVGDLIAQAKTLSDTDINNVFAAIEEVAKPFEMGANGVVIITSVSASEGSGPIVNWQRIGGGTMGGGSEVGEPDGAALLPDGLSVDDGDTVIVAEVRYTYTPWLYPGVINSNDLYHTAFFRPRQGTLTQITP